MKTSFSNFLQHFQTCQESFFFFLDESLWCALIVKGSQSPSVYLSTGKVSTLIFEVMFALRGGWTRHLLPQLRVRSSSADLSVKSKHSKKHVHKNTLIPFRYFILQYNTGLFIYSMGLKKKKTLIGLYLMYIWKMGDLCVRMLLQVSAVTSFLSEILKISTAAEKTCNLVVSNSVYY